MSARLPSRMMVDALIRRVNQAGGFATILCVGEQMGGTILIQTLEKGRFSGFFERMLDFDGVAALTPCGPQPDSESDAVIAYVERRRASDPDLWVVELDIVDAERFAAETMAAS